MLISQILLHQAGKKAVTLHFYLHSEYQYGWIQHAGFLHKMLFLRGPITEQPILATLKKKTTKYMEN